MKIKILTLFPEMFDGFINTSIIKRAIENQHVEVEVIQIRDYSKKKHNQVDDTPYGGGSGMVMMAQPVVEAILDKKSENSKVFLMGPKGKVFNQKMARELVQNDELVLICGHYEGIDARVHNFIDGEISIGDYILTGGELASMVISDALIRLCDNVIKEDSHMDESFENMLLEYPQYTKPAEIYDLKVPEVLLSGHHENIRKYRLKEALRETYRYRADLLENREFTKEELTLLEEVKLEENEKY